MRLFIIRHAVAEERDPEKFPDDGLRPLTSAGRRRFVKLLQAVRPEQFAPAHVLTSPLVRTMQTAKLVRRHCGLARQKVQAWDGLRPGADPAEVMRHVAGLGLSEDLAVVGHAPDVDFLAAHLLGCPSQAGLRLPKGAIAAFELWADPPTPPADNPAQLLDRTPAATQELSATLLWLCFPKLIKD